MFTRRYKKILICAALLLLIAAAVFSAEGDPVSGIEFKR